MDTKKEQGIYFTPYSTVKQILDRVSAFTFKSVLEPACGTGQFLEPIEQTLPGINITAVELNPDIYGEVTVGRPRTTKVINGDFLKVDFGLQKFDLIIGNPPYFVVPKNTVSRVYLPYLTGRPNIYILFILKSLELLNDNGILAFVLPNNVLNCHYYDKLRHLIFTDFTIIDILPQKNAAYVDTDQNTCVMIIQKKHPAALNEKFKVRLQSTSVSFTVFNTPELVHKMNDLLKGTTTLASLGFDVKVGNVVWNQCKDILTDNETDTRLLYSRDIGDNGTLNLQAPPASKTGDTTKKNYIRKSGTRDTMLLVNRGYGKGKYVFKYCLVDSPSFSYLVENHVTCIYRSDGASSAAYQVVIESFNDPRTLEFVQLYFENNAINTTELKYILPIWTTEIDSMN